MVSEWSVGLLSVLACSHLSGQQAEPASRRQGQGRRGRGHGQPGQGSGLVSGAAARGRGVGLTAGHRVGGKVQLGSRKGRSSGRT